MTHEGDTSGVTVELDGTELHLILTSLRLLLEAEDDAEEIARVERLIERLGRFVGPRDIAPPAAR